MLFFSDINDLSNASTIKIELSRLPVDFFIQGVLKLHFEDIVKMLQILFIVRIRSLDLLDKPSGHLSVFSESTDDHSISVLHLLSPSLDIPFEIDNVFTHHYINLFFVLLFDQPIFFIWEKDSHEISVLATV